MFSTKVLIQDRKKNFCNYLASSPLKLWEIHTQLNILLDCKPQLCRNMAELSICYHWHEKTLQHHLRLVNIKCAGISKRGKLLARWRGALFATLGVMNYRPSCTITSPADSLLSGIFFWVLFQLEFFLHCVHCDFNEKMQLIPNIFRVQ